MTDTELNIAIAKSCGRLRRIMTAEECAVARKQWAAQEPTPHDELTYPQEWEGTIPDYCDDLNAMHEAELNLENEIATADQYWKELAEITMADDEELDICTRYRYIGNASARQRAEAFWQTIRKGKE